MPDVNAGSIALYIQAGISPIPSNVSGIILTIVNNQRYFVEQYTGDSIGNVIAEKYQPCITDLSTANVIKMMAIQDNGVDNVRLFDEQVANGNLNNMAEKYQADGMEKAKLLTKGIKFYKARG